MIRRQFLSATASLAAVATQRSSFAATKTAPPGEGYIDFHVHISQGWHGKVQDGVSASDLLHWMDAHNVAQAIVMPLVSPEAFWYPVTTDFVLQETRPHRDRLIPFCAIDPRTLSTHLSSKQAVVDMLRRYRDAGARGFGEHKPMLPIDDPLCMRLYEACQEAGLPVLFHLDNQANMDRPGLPGLERVLTAFPDLVFIGHGKGWWASISGNLTQADLQTGYPKGPVAPGGAVNRLMQKHKNLYGDLSSSGAHAMLRDRDFGRQFMMNRADRLLFGTDYYDAAQQQFAQFEMFDQLDVPVETVRAISRENARRILKLA